MRFAKLHGAANDFIVVDGRAAERDWQKLAATICDRHTGAGADGLLVVYDSKDADLRMALYNADGSEAEQSGNGIRCFVKYTVDRGLAQLHDGALTVETLAGPLRVQASLTHGRVTSARVGMGKPRFTPQEVPVAFEAEPPLLDVPLKVDGDTLSLACVSMGNPHAVRFIDTPVADYALATIGPIVERHALFPQRVNFEVARVLSQERIEVRTWERGVGETLACGTGACAVAIAAQLLGHVGQRAEVRELGGTLTVDWDGKGQVFLTGPVHEVYEGEWPD